MLHKTMVYKEFLDFSSIIFGTLLFLLLCIPQTSYFFTLKLPDKQEKKDKNNNKGSTNTSKPPKKRGSKDPQKRESPSLEKLKKAIQAPETSFQAAAALLELNTPQGFQILKEAFEKQNSEIKEQIIRAIGLKKHPYGLKLLMSWFLLEQKDSALLKEMARSFSAFSKDPKLLEFLLSLVVDKSIQDMEKKGLAYQCFQKMVQPFPLRKKLLYYNRILENPNLDVEFFFPLISKDLWSLVGIEFHSPKEWAEWWKKNQTLPKTQLLEKIHKNFATQFENKKRAEFLWWKKYLETLEGLHSKEYLEVLLTPLQKGSNELQIYFCLQKIKSFVPNGKKDSDKIAKVLVQILHQIHWKKDIRALAIEGLGKFYSTCSPQWKGKTLLALKKILRRSSHISLRIKACNTLAALQETSVLTLFLSILRDPKAALPVVQEVIRNVSAFSETKDNQIVEAILYRLKLTYGEKISSSSMVNHSELLALSIEKLGGFPYYRSQTLELALQVLSHFLKHPSMKIRYFAATSLGRIGNVQSLLPLMEAFHSSDQAVQKAILKSMESIYVQNQKQIPQPLKKKILLFLWEYSKNLKLQSNLPSFFRKILTIEDISFFLFFLVQLKKNQTSNFLSLQYAQMILDVFRSISQKKGFTDGLANLDSSQKDLLFLMLGNANLVLKKYQKAIEAFKKVQKMNEWEELEFLLAKAKAGQHKEVLEDLKKRKFSLPPKQVQSIIQEIIQELGQDKSIKVNQLLEKWALEKTFDPTFLKSLGWSSEPPELKKREDGKKKK